jgi:hypothetical protein
MDRWLHRGLGRTKGGHHRHEYARFEVAANPFPLLGETDLVALGNDINRNGLTSPIAIQVKDGKPVLVDGRNRLEAMESSGCEFVWSEPTPDRGSCWSRNNSKTSVGSDCLSLGR